MSENPTKDFILNHLSENKDEINQTILESLKKGISFTIQYSMAQEIETQVKEVLKSEEVLNQIKTQISEIDLTSMLDDLLANVLSELATALKAKMLKNVQSSYSMDKIVKELFN